MKKSVIKNVFGKRFHEKESMQSLSGAEHCFDNARIESFFATLKSEKTLYLSD